MSLKVNEKGLVFLDTKTMTAIFDCVYGINTGLESDTKELLKEKMFQDFINLLLVHQQFNYHYRFEQTMELFPLFESTVGPMEGNSDGTILWLALGLAMKELYGMRQKTLTGLLRSINIRK